MILICSESRKYHTGWYIFDANERIVSIGEHIIASRLWRLIYHVEGMNQWDKESEEMCHPEYYKETK